MSNRDSACTPEWLTKLLPEVDIDPCSNYRSTVRAKRSYMLPHAIPLHRFAELQSRGFVIGDGLDADWEGKTVGINGPFSDLNPFAWKCAEAKEFWWLCNVDPSAKWWKFVTVRGKHRFDFRDRLEYVAPPGVDYSSNDRVSCLIVTPGMRKMIGDALDFKGFWWAKE